MLRTGAFVVALLGVALSLSACRQVTLGKIVSGVHESDSPGGLQIPKSFCGTPFYLVERWR